VRVCICVSELVVRPMITNPLIYVVLIHGERIIRYFLDSSRT
jgi:hypothetical protein